MKNIFLSACLLLAVSACTKEGLSATALPPNRPATAKTYVFPKGEHYATENPLKAVDDSLLHFLVRFDSSAIYQTADPDNQDDINKLYGFSDNGALHHQFSARLGWRWSDGALRLFAYTYNNAVREAKELAVIAISKEVDCSITVTPETYAFSVDGHTEMLPRMSKTARGKGYRLYPYFGGDEAAPHEIKIWIRELVSQSKVP